MGCSNSRQKYLRKLKEVSKNILDDRLIEEIIINTYYNEKELFYIYQRFLQLFPNEGGVITVNQLFEMREFKFCSFGRFLPRALRLNTERGNAQEVNQKIKEEKKMKNNEEDKKIDTVLSINNIDDVGNNKDKETEFKKLILNENNINSALLDEHRVLNDKEGEANNINSEDKIDFTKFCDIMKVFNTNYPVDLKIKFYFRLYDTDGDGRISKKDLKIFLTEVFSKGQVTEEFKEVDKDNIKAIGEDKDIIDYDKLIDLVFGEIVFNEKRTYIDFDEFSRILWTTTIDKSCVIDFVN